MCTVVVSLEPGERYPLRLLGIRDELVTRPWRPPARHWPGQDLIGGIDELAGGTWLAVQPAAGRVACLLNGRGPLASPTGRRSRGELPLRVAAEGPGVLAELAADPAAIAVRHEYPDGRVHGTTSMTLVSLGPGHASDTIAPRSGASRGVRGVAPPGDNGLRYDFQPAPGNPGEWYSVTVG